MTRRAVLMTVAIAGCGRLGFDASPPDAAGPYAFAPAACDHLAWPTAPITDLDVDLSIANTPSGVSVIWAPYAGGDLNGVDLDASWAVVADQSGTNIKPTGPWYSTSLAYIDGTLVEAESDGSNIKLDTVQPDLSSASERDCPMSSVASKPPFVRAGPDTVALTSWLDGVTVHPFAADWTAMPTMLTEATAAATAMTAVTYGAIAVVAWSTPSTCYVEQLANMATGTRTQGAVPCAAPRIAAGTASVAMVFESPEGVRVAVGDPAALSSDAASLIAPGATSPRIAFDGNVFWISYLTAGGIGVGYVLADGTSRSTVVPRTPAHDAYELAIANGAAWLIAIDGGGLAGDRLCLAGP